MLKPEQAQEALKQVRIEDWHQRRLAALKRLSRPLAEVGRAVLGYDAQDKPLDWSEKHTAHQMAVEQLDAMTAGERGKVFATLFPKIAGHLEAAWQLCHRLPFQIGWGRKAFRAPTDPVASRPGRNTLLDGLLSGIEGYDEDITWLAAWAPHLYRYGGADALGLLFAAAIDEGGPKGDTVFDILCDSARGEHDIGGMGRHVTRGLLVASRPDGWEFVEKLLLAAQRQEGLRQVILETIDEAHPEAFRRMVRLIRDHDLARFSATVRAVNVWFGFQWDSVSVRVVNEVLEQGLRFLEDEEARTEALARGSGDTLYLALWTRAFEDATAAVTPAAALLADAAVERRFLAAHFLGQLQLPAAKAELLPALEDEDLRVALRALDGCRGHPKLFEPMERLLDRLPAKKTALPALVWPWTGIIVDRAQIASTLANELDERPATRLIRYLPLMSPFGRCLALSRLTGQKRWDGPTRDTLFALVGDSSSWVRNQAVQALARCQVNEEDAQRMEGYLTRQATDLRRGVAALLLNQKDNAALASADRLLASTDRNQRLGGLELLRQLAETRRLPAACRARAEAFRAGRSRLSEEEQECVAAVLDAERPVYTLDDALGLMNPAGRTKPVPPRKRDRAFLTPAALVCLKTLDDLIHEHRETSITVETYEGPKPELLGNLSWTFPSPKLEVSPQEDAARLPLREVWEDWLAQLPRKLRDEDRLQLVRAHAWHNLDESNLADNAGEWNKALRVLSGGLKPVTLRYPWVVERILSWLLRLHPPAGAVDFLLDTVETSFALVPAEARTRVIKPNDWGDQQRDWRESRVFNLWLTEAQGFRSLCPAEWSGEHHLRLWQLLRWRDEPATGVYRYRPDLDEILAAYQAGGATEADLVDQLLGPRGKGGFSGWDNFGELSHLTRREPAEELERCPALRDLVERCRSRILEIELARGETETAASQPARVIGSLEGADTLLRLLSALGKKAFARGYGLGKPEVLTHLIQVTHPAERDTPKRFAVLMKEAGVPTQRLIDLAFLAPQWVRHVEYTLEWSSLEEGVWWLIAHTREAGLRYDGAWKARLAERTALTVEELAEGAVDVPWFQRTHAALGPKRWQALCEGVRYATSGNAYKRALLLAAVLRGRVRKSKLVDAIRQKNNREAVRLLGLLPLASGKARERDLLDRYRVLQEYVRYARQLSAMTREGAQRTAVIGLNNLARTAGYPDPIRFEWAMEAQAVADLAQGSVTISVEGVSVSLGIDAGGLPDLTVVKKGKPLKAIPPAVKKIPAVAELVERKTELKRQASRTRLSLEAMMCRGDTFTGAELRALFAHPVLVPQLERLVLIGDGILGYPVSGGKALRDHAGKVEPVKKGETLRLAHPHDLLKTRQWHLWQHDCFAAERVQPFKQVFRELYVLTEAEKADGTLSRRYAGQQVNPRQATALWGSRGWLVSADEGVSRTFHDAGLTTWVTFLAGTFTPAEIEGWTIEGVRFARRGEWKLLELTKVPPRLFSEVMRDLDLVVSVAHRGGVDPEASASTVEMRAALLRETCVLLKLDNVRVQPPHVLVGGELSDYSVHLGSGVTHRQPGGALCLVPVHAQHRGRLFLPFADDDPKTAEVLSKVILLARDAEIQDPNILDQLRAR
jgi:hypothetical protein